MRHSLRGASLLLVLDLETADKRELNLGPLEFAGGTEAPL